MSWERDIISWERDNYVVGTRSYVVGTRSYIVGTRYLCRGNEINNFFTCPLSAAVNMECFVMDL